MQRSLYRAIQKIQDYSQCAIAMLCAIGFLPATMFAQQNPLPATTTHFIKNTAGPSIASSTGASQVFIENIGQYGSYMQGYDHMGPIRYGYEGQDMPVLFTTKGVIYLQRKLEKLSHREEEQLEKAGAKEAEIERKKNNVDRTITMEWLGANENAQIIKEEKAADYHTYGLLPDKAYGYKKITYRNIYPGIDIVYHFTDTAAAGFEYSIVAAPGADLRRVKMIYGGDVKSIKTNSNGALVVRSDIDGLSTSMPVSYYGEKLLHRKNGDVKTAFNISGNQAAFSFPQGYDKTKAFILDPFVSSTSNLTGTFAGKAIDVDYDYAGNVYVAGGGSTSQAGTASHSHAKYNSAGVLQWTFNGVLSIPIWQAGYYFGGWVVDKASGALYIGQGFAFQGFQVIRVSTTGLYDNYISTANTNFQEDWKMYWFCNNGSPQIICAGGGTTGNNNIAICAPPSTNLLASANLTGAAAAYQDMSDLVIDPVTNSLYSIYASGLDKTIENRIFKHNAPFSAATIAWSTPSGYTVLGEILNRPYLGGSYADNSSNILAVNASYLFYWDGQNLKAFDKASGAGVGAPLTIAGNLRLNQGGIVADACNNVFIGNTNGTIKVYKFNGTVFDDAAAPDIGIPGYSTNVYDLALDESKKLLYASGDGFVASFDVSAYCPTTNYTVSVTPDCSTASATASISPAPPPGSTVTYTLFNGTQQVGSSNTTGVFTGLTPNINYTVVATVNLACSGTQASTTFVLPGPTINFTKTNSTCGANTGSITATGSGTPGPYQYSLNGGPFQPGGTFTGLAEGNYTLVVQGAGGCPNDTVITILNSNGPAINFTQNNATCGNNTGTVTATASAGTAPYQYSINGGTTYQSGNFFTGLTAGDYTLVVKDAGGCTNRVIVTIISSPPVSLTAIPASATCNQNNGSITAFGTDGTAPLQYSINGNTFQPGNVFTGITPGVYAVTVKDAIGCFKTINVTVDNVLPPTVTAASTGATCNNINGSITATGSNGIPPYQYSINGGVSYQTGNVFTGLAPGIYTITIKDATGCINTVAVTIVNTTGPSVTATATTSSCAASTGTITASASGGTAPYQYSINGSSFVAGNVFAALAPANYVIYVKDNTGCVATIKVVVTAIAGPSITAVATPASCIANNGVITATGTGGTAPLQYSLDGITYIASNVFNALPSSSYTVYVKDANGCIKTTTAVVGNASGLGLSVSAITSSCSIGNGVLTATATGGIAPLQYSIDGVVYQAGNVFSALSSGSYTVYVKDANGCIVTKPAIVSAVAGPTFSLTLQQNATCGTASGVVRVTASGGVAPLSYNIDGGAFQPVPIFINVTAGVHSISVKDASGCAAASQNITVANVASGTAITDVTFTVRDVLGCTGEGRIKNLKGFPTGGGNNYEFSLDGGPFTTANQFRPVSVGTHTITARNRTSLCTITKLVTIGLGTPATATAVATPSACGATTGTINITGVGANTPYHASIDNGITWQTFFPPGGNAFTFTGLAPGIYPIIIADDADFTAGPPDIAGACLTTIFVTVPSTGGPSISTTQVNPSCSVNTGTITASGSGGTGPYTYSIDGGAFLASGVFASLSPGIHAIAVKDATGCINGVNITLASASVPTVTADVVATSCNLNNGTITANGSGGAAPLEYSINGTVYVSSNVFTGLTPGNYSVYVRDANKCFSSITVTIANTSLPKVTAYTIAASCNNNDGTLVAEATGGQAPYTFSINGSAYQSSSSFSDLPAGFYTVYLKDARGCISTTGITITNATGPLVTPVAVAATCGNASGNITVTVSGGTAPYQYSKDGINFQAGNIFTGLLPGTYPITVKDANGCSNTKAIAVANINGPQTPVVTFIHAACGAANGTITGNATGGVAPLQYSIDGTNYQAGNSFTNLPAGAYTFYVKDANGCTANVLLTLQNLSGPSLTVAASGASCGQGDGSVTATVIGGTLPLTYSRDGVSFQPGNIFTGLSAGPYTITVKDARGCTASTTITVTTIGTSVTPTFAPVGPVCAGTLLSPLPTTSLNGISGTWSPALNNTTTTTYTFTPAAGQCAASTTLTVTVTPSVSPTFNPVAAVCAGSVMAPLPTTSLNGITGTWAPALNNSTTTNYTFTPAAGQCAGIATLTINVTPAVAPVFNAVAPVCTGSAIAPLPTTSLNGITGTWAPALNNSNTTTYTFTPAAGQCANTATLTITVTPAIIPGFNPVAPVCTGSIIAPLPNTSLNGITGTWAPVLNTTTTTTYTFTPAAGQCASNTTLTITVTPAITPTFNPAPPACAGSAVTPLPTTSLNGITGSWTPALNNTATTIYTFTPDAGQCASSTTMSITVNPVLSPVINCGASTTSSVSFNWAALAGATGYSISYQAGAGPVVSVGNIGNLLTYQVTGLSAGDNVQLTVTPIGNAGTCFSAATASCTATACTPPTANIAYGGPFCVTDATIHSATLTGTGAYTGGVFSAPPGLTTDAVTGSINASTSAAGNYTVTYTIAASGGCPGITVTATVTITASTLPSFNPIAPVCAGSTIAPLPTTSLNGISGTWTPALNNTATTVYTFTPAAGQCATNTTLTVTVTPAVAPTFNPAPAVCAGSIIAPLPTTSLNGITGSWAPALNNTTTTTYTFTPVTGQCAATTTLTITITPAVTPAFAPVAPVCTGTAIASLPTTSLNGITGTWTPALNNTATTLYTFTPAAGQCAAATTLTITVTPAVTPTFTPVPPLCSGSATASLPNTSLNGVTGSWSPAINNTATTVYTFTPTTGQCAASTTLTITVTPAVTPTFNPAPAFCAGATIPPLPGISLNGITGTWSPALNNTATTTYTFTPDAGQCAVSTTLVVTVNPILSPVINCGVSTTSSVSFTWAAIAGATGYSVSYQVGAGPVVSVGNIGNLLTYQVTGLSAGDNVQLTVTPVGNAGTCFNSGTAGCTATACTPPTASITYGGPFCTTDAAIHTATLTGTGAYSGGLFSAPPGLSIDAATGSVNASTSIAGNYTVTYTVAASGGCPGIAVTVPVTITASATPLFNAIAPICAGTILAPLPVTSLNDITGTWAPALNNTTTTIYTFTPAVGQCASNTTLTITVTPAIVPGFNPVAPVCEGTLMAALPTVSLNGITGSWTPALNNTATTTYTFTPAAGQCATSSTMTVAVNPILRPVINCGVSTTVSVAFNWTAVAGASNYDVSYQVNGGPVVNAGAVGNTLNYIVNGLAAGDIVNVTVTPGGNTGSCFGAATASCTATACTPPTASIFYTGPFCVSDPASHTVSLTGTGSYTGGIFSAASGLSIDAVSGSISPASSLPGSYLVTYTIAPSGGCTGTTATSTVNIAAATIPSFATVAPVCAGEVITPLPTVSLNGITGSWSPALNNTTTTTYTFTPAAGQCAANSTMVITVNPIVSPVINCGVSTTSSVSFTWAAVAGATGYVISYQVGTGPVTSAGNIGNLLTYQVTGLAAGDIVRITVTPAGGTTNCFASSTASCTATACTPPTASIAYASPFCNTGSISAVTLTGTGAYTGGLFTAPAGLTIDATTGSINPATSTPGNYTVTYSIAATGSCAGVIATAAVGITPATTPLFTAVAPVCAGDVISPLPLISTNGISGTWLPVANNTATTTYTFTPNAGQCATNTTLTITVNPPPAAPAVTVTQPDCAIPTGSIVINASSGQTFSIDGGAYVVYPAGGFTGIAPGTHTLSAKNSSGCVSLVVNIIVNAAPAPPTAVNTTISDARCGAATGAITIGTVTGGLAPYSFSIDGSAFTSNLVYSGLAAGVHTITVKDNSGCRLVSTVTVNAAGGATVSVASTPASCGNNNGSITATGSGGALPYQFSVDGINFQPGNVFTGLSAGNYTIAIKDANSCINSIAITVTGTSGATVTAFTNPASCSAANGSITAAGNGGTAPYRFSIDGINFQPGNIFNGLTAGNYIITIKDAGNCTNTISVTVTSSNGPTVIVVTTAASCTAANGSITATALGGTTPYRFSIDGINFQSGTIFTGLPAGNYTITVKDANNCSNRASAVISSSNSTAVTANATTASCGQANGSITATGSGGAPPYQYALNNGGYQASNSFSGLPAGVYTVTIKDRNGCTASNTITINSINTTTVNAGNDITICQGSSAQLQAATNAASYSWLPVAGLSNTGILNPVASPAVTTAYIITATTGQCSVSDTVIVHVTPAPIAFAGADARICFGNTLQLHGSGGNNYFWSPAQFLSGTGTQNPVFSALQQGVFTILLDVTDANGCKSAKKDSLLITVLPPAKIFAGNDTAVAAGQPLPLNATDVNNTGFTSYTWSPSAGLNNAFIKNPVALLNNSNLYTYTVTARTAAGCEATDDINIKVFVKPELYVPNAFTPNDDGRNDVLKLIPVGIRELKFFTIYNRFGEIVFATKNLQAGWDGNYKGQKQDSNTFVWVAEAVDINGNILARKGIAILIR